MRFQRVMRVHRVCAVLRMQLGKRLGRKKNRHLALSVTRFASRVHILLLIFIFPMKLAMLPPPIAGQTPSVSLY